MYVQLIISLKGKNRIVELSLMKYDLSGLCWQLN